MLRTAVPAGVAGGAMAESVAGPRASVWVRVRSVGAAVVGWSCEEGSSSVCDGAGSDVAVVKVVESAIVEGVGSAIVEGVGSTIVGAVGCDVVEASAACAGWRARVREVCGSVNSSTGVDVCVAFTVFGIAAGASGKAMLGRESSASWSPMV